jgi:hypothetical protein
MYNSTDDQHLHDRTCIGCSLCKIVVIITLVLLLFSFAYLVADLVWIFDAKTNDVQGLDPTSTTTYCQSKLYNTAFVLIIVNYIIHTDIDL